MPKVLVIVVTYNGMQWLDRCLGSVRNSSIPLDAVVIDNGSTDGSCEHIETAFPEVKLIRSAENLGFGAANNIGLRMALEQAYDYVYLLNQDAWIEENTIASLIAAWDRDYAIISPLQKAADGSLDANFRRKCRKYLGEGLCEVPFVMAAHWMMNIEAVKRIGGFSPVFRQYGEDDNYIDRAHFFGLKVGVLCSCSAVHDRAQRKESKARRMRLKCIATVVRMSDPACIPFLRKIRVLFELLAMSVKNLSAEPLRFIPELIKKFAELDAARAESRKESAFL